MRTQEEIAARLAAVRMEGTDVFGVRQSRLAQALTFDGGGKMFANPGTTAEDWDKDVLTEDGIHMEATEYLVFAFEKAASHRGLSAARSIDHMREFVWLLCTDEQYDEFDRTRYAPYGVPQLRKASSLLDSERSYEDAVKETPYLSRMAAGLPHTDDCTEGCFS